MNYKREVLNVIKIKIFPVLGRVFCGSQPLITNFGELSPVAGQSKAAEKNLVVLWENLKTGQKHFPIKRIL